MGRREVVHGLLVTAPEVAAAGLSADRLYGSTSLDTPDTSSPFATQRWGETPVLPTPITALSVRMMPSKLHELTIWVYDAPGDYARIDAIISAIRGVLGAAVGLPCGAGWLTQIDWAGDSEDLYDDAYHAIMRTTSYRVITSDD